jgi:hypothetical protein
MKIGSRSKPKHAQPDTPVELAAPVAVAPTDLKVTSGGGRLGELLIAAKLSTEDQIVEALQLLQSSGGKRLGQLLIELGTLDEHGLARTLAAQNSLDVVDLREVTPEDAATRLLSE